MSLFDTEPEEFDFQNQTGSVKFKASAETVQLSGKFAMMKEAIGDIERGKCVWFISAGSWALHDLLRYVLNITGPADVDAFTWSISIPGATQLIKLKSDGLIRRLGFIAHMMFKKWSAAAIDMLQNHCDRLHVCHIHAKGFCLRNEKWHVSVISSANYTNNPAIEGGVITCDEDVYSMNMKWIDKIHEKGLEADKYFEGIDIDGVDVKRERKEKKGDLFIIRGLPGSGKSTLAHAICEKVYENDDYFTSEKGEYLFDLKRMHQARAACLRNVMNDMEAGVEKIAVANTFVTEEHLQPYIDAAKRFGYEPHVMVKENRHGGGSVHGVKPEVVKKMQGNFKVKLA